MDFYLHKSAEDIVTETTVSDVDYLAVSYFFRDFNEMPAIEQKALELANGKVLDVGAAAGAHSLYLQNERNLEVFAIDISPLSVEVCKLRGIKNAVCANLLELENENYDTLLLLMNGTGIFQNFSKLDLYLEKLYRV